MERPHLFSLGDNNKIAKVHSRNLKIHKFVYIIITSLKSIHWFELVSQVSDVAHGPLVIIGISVFNYLFIPARYQNKIYHNLGLQLVCRGFLFTSKLISSFISDRKFLFYNNRKFWTSGESQRLAQVQHGKPRLGFKSTVNKEIFRQALPCASPSLQRPL